MCVYVYVCICMYSSFYNAQSLVLELWRIQEG